MVHHLAINTAKASGMDSRLSNSVGVRNYRKNGEAKNKHDNSGREISEHPRSSSTSQD